MSRCTPDDVESASPIDFVENAETHGGDTIPDGNIGGASAMADNAVPQSVMRQDCPQMFWE